MNKFFTLAAALCWMTIVNCQQSAHHLIEINPRIINFKNKLPFNHIKSLIAVTTPRKLVMSSRVIPLKGCRLILLFLVVYKTV